MMRTFATTKQMSQFKGNFEFTHEIPPRYFMLTYDLKPEMMDDIHESAEYSEHQ